MRKARKNEIKKIVLRLLRYTNTQYLPVDLEGIKTMLGIKCLSFCQLEHSIFPQDSDGFSIKKNTASGKQFLVIYNHNMPFERVRWTDAHEIGHCCLGHLDSQQINQEMEQEANYFAKELLMPLAVLDKLNIKKPADISKKCGVSYSAAFNRIADFEEYAFYQRRYGYSALDEQFIKQFCAMYDAGETPAVPDNAKKVIAGVTGKP